MTILELFREGLDTVEANVYRRLHDERDIDLEKKSISTTVMVTRQMQRDRQAYKARLDAGKGHIRLIP